MKYNSKLKENNIKTTAVIASVGIIIAILAVIIYLNIDFVRSLLNLDSNKNPDLSSSLSNLPTISDNYDAWKAELFYVDPDSVTDKINVRGSYVRKFRIISSFNGEKSLIQYTLTKNNDRYKLESNSSTIVFDGEYMQIKSDVYSYKTKSDESELYSEIGIALLDEILDLAERNDGSFSLSGDNKYLIVEIVDNSRSIKSIYEVSLETGIVTYEAHYYNNVAYMTVLTENIDVFGADELPEDFFTLQ